jgi:putative transposase
MDGSIRLSPEQRNALLRLYRTGKDARASRRAHIVLLLSDGRSCREVRAVTYASFQLISDCAQDFRQQGLAGLLRETSGPRPWPGWLRRIVAWLTNKTPEDFGYFRSRWSCETLAEVLAWETRTRLSGETIRRGLRRAGFVWRRPRPVLGRTDPQRGQKLREIQQLLEQLPLDEAAVFQDEADVHLNPKIGSCWMLRGQQAEVSTPGDNIKRHLAGSLVWRTGTLLLSPAGTRRNADLFLGHLDDLRRRLRGFRVIHVICDNASFHSSRRVHAYLRVWRHRIRLHYLPKYAPETNPIERIWWRMHETLTRNHRCQSIDQLLDNIFSWVNRQRCFFTRALADYATAA